MALDQDKTGAEWVDKRTFCTAKRRRFFLRVLRETGCVLDAVDAVQENWSRPGPVARTWYRLRKRDERFRAEWELAIMTYKMEQRLARLAEAEAKTRGLDNPVRAMTDAQIIATLRRLRPETWGRYR